METAGNTVSEIAPWCVRSFAAIYARLVGAEHW